MSKIYFRPTRKFINKPQKLKKRSMKSLFRKSGLLKNNRKIKALLCKTLGIVRTKKRQLVFCEEYSCPFHVCSTIKGNFKLGYLLDEFWKFIRKLKKSFRSFISRFLKLTNCALSTTEFTRRLTKQL